MSTQWAPEWAAMTPVWLTFRAAQLEEKWQASQELRRRNGDEGFFTVFGLLVGIGALRALRVRFCRYACTEHCNAMPNSKHRETRGPGASILTWYFRY